MKRERNKNSLFILPIFDRTIKFYGKELYDIYINKENDQIMFVFIGEPKNNVKNFLINSEEFRNYTEYEKGCIFSMQIPEIFEEDLEKYKNGKYSKLSKGFKNKVLTLNPSSRYELQIIMYPKQKDRDALAETLDSYIPEDSEIYDSIDEKYEYYSRESIREKLGEENR